MTTARHLHHQQAPPAHVSGRRPDGSWRLPLRVTAHIEDAAAFAAAVHTRWACVSERAQAAVIARLVAAHLDDTWRVEYWQQGPCAPQVRTITLMLRVPGAAGEDLDVLADQARAALRTWAPQAGIASVRVVLDTHWAAK